MIYRNLEALLQRRKINDRIYMCEITQPDANGNGEFYIGQPIYGLLTACVRPEEHMAYLKNIDEHHASELKPEYLVFLRDGRPEWHRYWSLNDQIFADGPSELARYRDRMLQNRIEALQVEAERLKRLLIPRELLFRNLKNDPGNMPWNTEPRIVIDGQRATGKTELAKMLAQLTGANYLNLGMLARGLAFAIQEIGFTKRIDALEFMYDKETATRAANLSFSCVDIDMIDGEQRLFFKQNDVTHELDRDDIRLLSDRLLKWRPFQNIFRDACLSLSYSGTYLVIDDCPATVYNLLSPTLLVRTICPVPVKFSREYDGHVSYGNEPGAICRNNNVCLDINTNKDVKTAALETAGAIAEKMAENNPFHEWARFIQPQEEKSDGQ